MQEFIFDLQRFDTQEISAGETYELEGVTYTAVTDAVFNLDDDGKISGLASGKVQATIAGEENSPTITFDATDGAIDFSATDDDALAVTLSGRQFKFTEGTATVTSDKVTTGAAKFSIAGTHSQADYEFTVEDSAEFSITPEAFVISSEKFNVAVLTGGNTLNLEVSGTATRNFVDHTFELAGGTTLSATRGDFTISATTTDDAGGELSLSADGITFTPNEGDGSLKVSVTRDGVTHTTSLDMTGSVTYQLNGSISLAKGTVVKNIFEDGRTVTVTANTDASGSMVFTPQDGLIITPATPDALSVLLSADGKDIIKLAQIDGTVNYSGGTFTASDGTEIRFVDPAGIYNDNVLRTTGGTTSLNFSTARIIYIANEGATFVMDYLQGTTWNLQNGSITDYFSGKSQGLLSLSEGSTFDTNDDEYPFTLEKEGTYMLNGMKVETTTANDTDVLFSNYETVTIDGISYTPLDDNVTITTGLSGTTVSGGKVSMQADGFGRSFGFDVTDGAISYDATTNKFSVTAGAKSLINGGDFPDQFVAKNNFGVTVQKNSDGTFTFSTDDSAALAIERNGQTVLQTTLTLDGSIIFDPSTHKITVPKDTTFTMTPGGDNILQITALDDAGGTLTLANGGIRFAPDAGDGALEFNFVNSNRKMTLDVTGAFTYGGLGSFSLEDGTEINIAWEDGNQIKLTSHGSTGSIGIDPTRGLRITSDDENLDMTFSTPSMSTDISGIKGTIYYNAGIVSFDENSKITATTTLGGQPILTTLETIDGTGHISFNTTNGVIYAADTGALQVTWSRGDLESTFTVNEGSVQLGHNLFRIAEGSDIATDLKNFVPAFYFTTDEAGNYTINGQTIKTSAANLALTATDDYMTFHTSDDVVTYDGMTFAGDGNVSLTADNVVLGAGVVANGFGEGNSFVLAEAGNVTADAKIFQLDPLSLDDGREIPMIITVTGAQDGFIFSRTLTEESEEYLDYLDSPYVGSIFTEKFIAAGDSSYRIRTDPIGLEDVIGISNGATITGGATLDDEETLSYYLLVTDTTGKFTIGKKTYTLADGTELGTGIRARFDVDSAPYADKVSDLNGTISGDFTEGQFSVNGGAGIKIFGDKDVSISANDNGVEIYGLSDKATLASVGSASKVHTDTTGEFVFGNTADDSLGLTVTGDPNVTFEFDLESQDIMAINDLEGSLQLSETSHLATINGITCDFDGKFSSVGAYDNALYLHDVSDGSSIITDDEDKIWLQQVGASMAVNTNEFTLAGDEDGIWIRDKEIVGLDEGASLKVSDAGNYTVNTANISAKAGDVIVGLENGNDAYIFNANNPLITKNTSASALVDIFNPENVSIVSASDKGRFDISLTGGDLAIVENTAARVNITAGDDTVVSQGKNVHLNLTGGDTWLFALGGKMTIDGYDLSSGTGFGTTYGDIVSAVKDGRIDFGNGKLSMSGAVADFNTQSQLVNFFDRNGTRQIVGFAGNYASLNASDSTDNLLLSGDKNSTLIAGSGNDTIFAAEGNFVDAGAGKNSIYIKERDENSSGVEINLDGGGNDTVHNFRTGFENSSDAIANNTGHWHNFFDGTNVTINTASGTAVLQNVGSGEAFMKLKEVDNGVEYKVAVAQKNSVIAAGADIANIYSGENSAVDFTGFSGSLSVNLTEGQVGNIGGENVYFYGINYVAAGDGVSTLIGSSDDDTLIAGNGYGSLWGGKGSDNLIGQADSSIKNGMTSFFFFAGDGNDTVSNFEFLTRENKFSGNADKIAITADIVTRGKLSGDDVVLQLNDGDDYLTLEDAAGKNFRLNEYTVKVDKNISYDGFANCYVADGGSSLTVDSTVDSAEIWLDSSHGNLFFGNIRTLDASAVEGRTSLAGYALDETIIAGHGDSSLWGGVFGDDLLIGGESKNTFFYHLGDGNDAIQGANDGDIVDLNTLTIDQVVGEIGADGVVLKFTDGGSLTVDNTAVEFRINNDGTTYVVDNGEWKTK